jgi:hypothetical protein
MSHLVKLAGKRWTIRNARRLFDASGRRVLGRCDYRKRELVIVAGQMPRENFNTVVHEAVHAICPFLDETAVADLADDLASLLYDHLGYRRTEL